MDVPKPMHRLESGLVQHVPQRFLIHGNHPTAEARSLSRICSLEISRRFPRYVSLRTGDDRVSLQNGFSNTNTFHWCFMAA